jgi:ABC-type glycerol-3-phosphate transport system substrate-binding protein
VRRQRRGLTRRVASTLLAAAALAGAVFTVGCGSGDDDDGAEGSNEPVTLTVWNSGYFPAEGKEVWDQIDREFEEANPNIDIQHEGIPYENLYVRLRGTIAARRGPDLVTLFPGAFAGDYRDGFAPLDEFITDGHRDENPLWKTSQSPDGKTYAVPLLVYGYMLTYNKALLRKAGLDPESPPTTEQELYDTCAALREAGIEPLAAGWRDGYLLEWYLFVYGGQLLSPEDTDRWMRLELPAANPAFQGALEFVRGLEERGCFKRDGATASLEGARDQFARGEVAMALETSGNLTLFRDELGDDLGVALPPRLASSQWPEMTDAGADTGFGITAWSDHPEEAWKYIEFAAQRENQELFWAESSDIPVNRTAATPSEQPAEEAMLELMKLPDNHTIYTAFPASVLIPLEKDAPAFLEGRASADDVLGRMDDALEKAKPRLK